MLILFIIGLVAPIIIVHRKGKDPHGTSDGYSILARLSIITIIIWLFYIILYLFSNEANSLIWTFPFLNIDLLIVIGMLIIAIGFFVEYFGIKKLGINFRVEFPKEKTELIISGIYRLIRNPIALGVYFLLIGSFLIIPNIYTLIISIINIIAFDRKVRDEEKFLLERFEQTYEEYKKKVGRYLPFRILK